MLWQCLSKCLLLSFDRKPMCLPSCWAHVCSSLLRICWPGCVSCASNSSSWIRAHWIWSALHHTQIYNSCMHMHKLMNMNTGTQTYLYSTCKQQPIIFMPDWQNADIMIHLFLLMESQTQTVVNLFHFFHNRLKCVSLVPRSCSCWQSGQRRFHLTSEMRRWSDTLKTSSTG